jgi:hypothetical protein
MPEAQAPTGQPTPPPFQPQYAPQPPRSDGQQLPVRGRHGGAPDSQEMPRPPRADLNPPGPTRSGPPTGTNLPRVSERPDLGRSDFSGPPTGGNLPRISDRSDFSGPPTGSNLPRISDQSRRSPDGYGPDMYSNEPPRPNSPRREGAPGRVDGGDRDTNRDENRDEIGSRTRG